MKTKERKVLLGASKMLSVLAALVAVAVLCDGVSAATFAVTGSQEIGGAAPVISGELDGTPAELYATGMHPNWTFTWAGVDLVDLTSAALTYTRVLDTVRGTVVFDLGGAVLGGMGGVIRTMHVREASDSRYYRSDHFSLLNVVSVGIGGINTSADRAPGSYSYPYGGNISIGTEGAPVSGAIRVGSLKSFGGRYNTSATYAGGGNITVYGQGDVIVVDGADVVGDVLAWSSRASAGNVVISHRGRLEAGDIDVSIFGGGSGAKAGDITLDGGNCSGDLVVRSVRANYSGGNYAGGTAVAIVIRNYANVLIGGDVEAWNYRSTYGNYRRDGGNVTVEGISGDIWIGGRIDLRTENNSASSVHGTLRLTAGGKITLAQLDLSKVASAQLSSGSGRSFIAGELLNFDTSGSSGDGSPGNPIITTQTVLRAPVGQVVCYNPKVNSYLGGKAYRVADLAGHPGQGGLLMSSVRTGTGLILR